jgi:hypothetical protein
MVRRQRLCFLLVFLFIAPAWSVMLAQAQGGTITTFSSGSALETVTVSSGQHGQIGFELQRNTTITSASFFIKPDSTGNSPGSIDLDVNGDGLYEWTFNQTGYGHMGRQFQFTNGNQTVVVPVQPNSANQSNPSSPSFFLPSGASVSNSNIGVGFSPELIGGFFQTGYIHDVSVGDLNGDGNDDFVLFSQVANYSVGSSGNGSNSSAGNTTGNSTSTTANYTVGPAFQLVSFSNATGVAFSSWTPTCNNVTRTMSADLNGDGYDDVINYAPANRLLCIHFVNSTTGASFEPQVNVTHSAAIKGLDFADFTGNGRADMVSIQNNGVVSIDAFSNRTNTFSNEDSLTLYVTGTQTPATLSHMLLDHFNGTSNPPILIAVDSSNDGTEVFWASGSVVASTSTIAGISSDAVVGDFDGDGDLDIVASRSTGHRSIENTPQGWSGDNHNNVIDLTNATILDYDLDMDAHILMPSLGQVDGNPATLDGNFTAYGFQNSWNSQNRVRQQASAVLEPWTAPRAMFLGDLDGDGFIEHLVLAGEGSQHGVFISAWHQVGYDADNNGQIDFQAEGYAGNGSNGLPMLSIIDVDGNLTGILNFMSSGLSYSTDAYGIQMSEVNFSMQSLTAGAFTFSGLDVAYVSDFLVNVNPEITGNLSNVLNQQMTGGTGSFTIPFTFTTTQDGSFVIHTPTVAYIDGAPNIALPPAPVLSLVDAQPNRVVFEWQNVSDFGDDVLNFAVYRAPTGQSPTTQSPYSTSLINNSIDMDVKPGEAWSYWVRSVHDFGVTSNLSQPLNVMIPYPTPKSYLPNVTASDVPSDNGGAMQIQWSQGDESIVEHRVYVFATDFTSISSVNTTHTTDATTRTLVIQQDSAGQPLVDGDGYYVAVVGFDQYGNASDNVTTVGPVYTRNDTALPTTLEVSYVGFAQESSIPYVLLARQGSLEVEAYFHQDGQAVANHSLTLHVVGESEQYSSVATTNETGHAMFAFTSLSDLGPISAVGPMQLKVTFDGFDQDATQQPLMGASNMTDAYGIIPVTILGDSIIELDDALGFDSTFTVNANDMTQQDALANMRVYWMVTNQAGQTVDDGTADVRGNEMAISGLGAYDGTLTMYIDAEPPQFYYPSMLVSFAMEASPDDPTDPTNNQTNTTEESTFPDITLAPTVDCGTATYGWEDNATDVTITCSVSNPNPFEALIGFSWKIIPNTPPSIDVVYNDGGSTATVDANGTVDLTFTLVRNGPTEGLFSGLQGKGYVITLTCVDQGTNACDSMSQPTNSSDGEIQWTLGEMPVVDDGNSNTVTDETSSAMTPVVVGIGLVIAILAAIGGVLYMRGRVDEDDDDDDDEDYYGMAMDAPTGRAETVESLDLGASKSLDELKESGIDLHEAAPEGLASSVTLGSSADAFEFGATAEDSLSSEPSDDDEETSEASEYEEDAGDDGITVDENGTEWWEDEDGVWWYREEGWEDWAVWED